MALTTCPDCAHDCSELAPGCPRCGRPLDPTRERVFAFELAAILALFGAASIVYALVFHESLLVTEERVKFWFGFQLIALAMACALTGWWKRTRITARAAGAPSAPVADS